ncbi:hypothetical protein EXS45_01895 [Candidatus Nomurabacteria bacterium]|nr:hypothetical protein [Candidatus Nomurabacteria bacterium]
MKNKLIVLSGFVLGLVPVMAFAQGTAVAQTCNQFANQGTLETVICRAGSILNTIIPFLIVLGVLYFIWGVITYVIAADEEAKKGGRDKIIYGVIGLAVIIGVWGLVAILNRTFNPTVTGPVSIPCVIGTPGC